MKTLRILSIALLAALCFGILAGCKKAEETPKTDKQNWESLLRITTYDEVYEKLGKPDVPRSRSERFTDEYHDVRLCGVTGELWISSFTKEDLDADFPSAWVFLYEVGGDGTALAENLEKAKTAYQTVTEYLLKKYGEPVEVTHQPVNPATDLPFTEATTSYRWRIENEDGSVLNILLGSQFPSFHIDDQDVPGDTIVEEPIRAVSVSYIIQAPAK